MASVGNSVFSAGLGNLSVEGGMGSGNSGEWEQWEGKVGSGTSGTSGKPERDQWGVGSRSGTSGEWD